MKPFVTSGRVEGGHLKIRNQRALKAEFQKWKDGEVTVTIERAHATRSLDANALYWVGYVQPLSEHTGYTPMEIHAYLKKKFLPNQHLMIQNAAGEIVDETDLEPSTTKLNNVEFSEYLHLIQAWAAEALGIDLGSNREAA